MGANPWLGDSPHPRRRARGQTPAVSTLLTPVSLCFRIRRRPVTGDRFEIRERQSGYSCVSFVKYSQFTDSVLLHMRFHLRRRDIPVSRNSFVCCDRWHLRILSDDKRYPVGCDKVNCGNAAREGALGYDLGAPRPTIGTRYPVGEHIVLPRNVKSNGSRAHTVRPYSYACTNGLQTVRRVVAPYGLHL